MSHTNPTGYRTNAQGHLVPETQISEIDKLRDETVLAIVAKAKAQQQTLTEFKAASMAAVADFVDLSAAEYDVQYGGAKGNVCLTSFDGRYRIQRSVAQLRNFDERIQAAKALIDSCINRWSEGANDHIKALVDMAFRVNKQGHIDVNQVLSLRALSIDDVEWKRAMDAIADSIQFVGTASYLRIYERSESGAYHQIPLDIAKL